MVSDLLVKIIKFRSSEDSLGATAKKWVVGNDCNMYKFKHWLKYGRREKDCEEQRIKKKRKK